MIEILNIAFYETSQRNKRISLKKDDKHDVIFVPMNKSLIEYGQRRTKEK